MSIRKIIMLAAAIVLAATASGCMKTWSIDFTDDMGGWHQLTGYDPPGDNVGGDYGLRLSGTTLRADYGFNGDIEFSVVFDLNLGTAGEVERMDIYLGDGSDPAVNFIKIKFLNIGDGSNEAYFMYDNGSNFHNAGYIIGKVNNGENTFLLTVKGGLAEFSMNGTDLIGDTYAIVNYSNPFLVPYVFVQQGSLPPEDETADSLLLLKSLKVKYSGDKQSFLGP